jgi:hypothetical protein
MMRHSFAAMSRLDLLSLSTLFLRPLSVVALLGAVACAGSSGGTDGAGGADAATGGAAGAGGSVSAGGTASAGGATSVGGASSAGAGGTSPAAGAGGGGAAGAAASCFAKTPGTQPDVDRSSVCAKADNGNFEVSCQSGLQRACLPNYDVWVPIVCGAPPVDACPCDASKCLPGEAAKQVSGMFCACLTLCAKQEKGATCGANGERPCIPVGDASGKQVFICAGP